MKNETMKGAPKEYIHRSHAEEVNRLKMFDVIRLF